MREVRYNGPSLLMDTLYRIVGGTALRGDATISGSKNAALPLIAGSVLCSGETVIENVPDLRDVRALLEILEYFEIPLCFVLTAPVLPSG